MATPHESKEYVDQQAWRIKTQRKLLKASNCISSWTDICGFGNLLQRNNWNLTSLQNDGVVMLLNQVHSIAGRPLLLNPDPLPNDKVIVLNDGVARTIDFTHKDKLDAYQFLFFIRDLIFTHYSLLEVTQSYGVGVRTILAGGERIQYSPMITTGHSFLFYNEGSISPFGEQMLGTTFVYNPAEFQMNTAFAKAFTIDSLGSNSNIKINGFYIETEFLSHLNNINGLRLRIDKKQIKFYYENNLVFNLRVAETIKVNLKGLDVIIYHIDKLFIYKALDGDNLEFDLFKAKE